jgi:hypothetical protein
MGQNRTQGHWDQNPFLVAMGRRAPLQPSLPGGPFPSAPVPPQSCGIYFWKLGTSKSTSLLRHSRAGGRANAELGRVLTNRRNGSSDRRRNRHSGLARAPLKMFVQQPAARPAQAPHRLFAHRLRRLTPARRKGRQRASLTATGSLEWRPLSAEAAMRLLLRVLFVVVVFLAVAWAEWNGFF